MRPGDLEIKAIPLLGPRQAYWKQVWRKHIEALAIEPFAGCTAANLECVRKLGRRKVRMHFVERVGYPMSVSGA